MEDAFTEKDKSAQFSEHEDRKAVDHELLKVSIWIIGVVGVYIIVLYALCSLM